MIVGSKKVKKRKRAVLEKPLLPYYKTYQQAFKQWLIRLGYAESSTDSNTRKLGYFFSFLQSAKVQSIYHVNNEHIITYNSLLHSLQLSGTYIQSCHVAITNFNKYVEATENYKISFTAPRIEKHLATAYTILSQPEVKTLFKSVSHNLMGMRDKTILHLLYSCGLRSEEAARVQLKDLDYKRQLLYVQPGKTRIGRYVPIHANIIKDLQAYENYARPLLNPKGNYFLVTSNNNSFNTRILRRSLQRLLEHTSITKQISPHSLRHSIATHLLQQGMDIEQIAQFLGHKSLDTTQMYVRMNTELLYEKST